MAITTAQQTALIELYVAILDRAPAISGLSFWAQALENNGGDLLYVANEMWNSPGAQADYPAAWTTDQIVAEVFQNVFGRAPLAEGKAFWVAQWNLNGPAQTMLDMIENINTNPSTDPQFLLDKALFQNKVEFGRWYAIEQGLNDPQIAKDASELITSDPASIAVAQAYAVTDPAETVILTNGTDVETTGSGDDTFLATEQTLDTSDDLDGGLGYDVLEVSVEDENYFFTAPELSNIELITVTGGGSSFTAGTIDLSDAEGYSLLELKENEKLDFEWADIQDVIDVDLRIEDTNHGWVEYDYDTNAYVSLGGGNDDIVDLEVAEVDCLEITFGNETPNGAPSHIDQINLTSTNVAGVNNPSLFNYIWDLNVGPFFDTLIVDGDTHLEIEEFLDPSVTYVDSTALTSSTGLFIDMYGQGAVHQNEDLSLTLSEEITVMTGVGADRIDVAAGEDNYEDGVNGTYTLGAGADTLRVGVVNDGGWYMGEDECYTEPTYMVDCNGIAGNQEVDSGAGDDYIDIHARGEHTIVTAAGADWVHVGGDADDLLTSPPADGLTTIDTGTENDYVWVEGDGDFSVTLGTGADTLFLEGCGEDCAVGDSTVNAGDGDDYISMEAVGYQIVDAGAGADTAIIGCDCDEDLGEVSVTMGAGDDVLVLLGNSFDNAGVGVIDVDIDLGDGNDSFEWYGASGDTDLNDAVAVDAGQGNDTMVFTGDHRFDMEMGDGDDVLEMNADHLESQDSIEGGDGIDTIILHNGNGADNCDFGDGCGSSLNGTVRDSETAHTRGIEVFDLRNGNITLELTTALFETAVDNTITVITEESEFVELPPLTLLNDAEDDEDDQTVFVFSEGMSREDWDSIVEDWEDGLYVETASYDNTEAGLLEYLFDNGVEAVDFHDENDDGDDTLYTPADLFDSVEDGDDDDSVFFRTETCEQTIDVTAVIFDLVDDWHFNLLGGNVRDIIIANDNFISGDYTLRFDSAGGDAESIQDTLIIKGDLDMTDLDEEQITGLECIVLQGDGTSESLESYIWEIDLTEAFVNQTTGSADLEIFVDPNVPNGAELHLSTDDLGSPSNGVVVRSNSNVKVFIDGVQVPAGYNDGIIRVESQLLFTSEGDNLIGGSGNDIFYAQSNLQVGSDDYADGDSGTDELWLGFNVFNNDESLQEQIGDAQMESIEVLRFVTGNPSLKNSSASRTIEPVRMDHLADSDLDDFLPDILSVHTGDGEDELSDMESRNDNNESISYYTYGGDDYVDIDGYGGSVFAGDGNDEIDGSDGGDYLLGEDGDDNIDGDDGNDTIYGGNGEDDIFGGFGNDWIDGGADEDYIDAGQGNNTVNGQGGADTIYAGSGNDSVDGGSDDDYIDVDDGNNTVYGGTGSDTIYSGSGNDLISGGTTTNTTTAGPDWISSGSGNDTIYGSTGSDEIYSGDGSDDIYAGSGNDYIDAGDSTGLADGSEYVNAGAGDDYITFDWLSQGNGTTTGDTVIGGAGSDTLEIEGGAGNGNLYELYDDDFQNVSGVEALITSDSSQYINTSLNNGDHFEDSGIETIVTGSGSDFLDFYLVNRGLDIRSDGGADSIIGSSAEDTITAGDGADTVFGSAGADEIDLGADDGDDDYVIYESPLDGSTAGNFSGHDTITNFETSNDEVEIDGPLYDALAGGGGWDEEQDVYDYDLEGFGGVAELLVYTHPTSSLSDADLLDEGAITTFLSTALGEMNEGDNVLLLIQSANNTGLYYFQSDDDTASIDASEVTMLGLFVDAQLDQFDISGDGSDWYA